MKIASPCREQAKRVYDGAVFEIKKEIRDQKGNSSKRPKMSIKRGTAVSS
jgi:hypothetical protein